MKYLYEKIERSKPIKILLFKNVGPGFHSIDLEISSVSIFIADLDTKDDFNNREFCGLTNWKHGQNPDITGLVCDGIRQPDAGIIKKDILEFIAGEEPIRLGDRPSYGVESRPTKFGDTIYFPAEF